MAVYNKEETITVSKLKVIYEKLLRPVFGEISRWGRQRNFNTRDTIAVLGCLVFKPLDPIFLSVLGTEDG